MATCSPPKSQRVKAHKRSAARKKPKPPAAYYVCVLHGRSCGTKHRTLVASYRHKHRLQLKAHRRGVRERWETVKRG